MVAGAVIVAASARPGASDAELAAAADRARLLDWITSLPRGWDTPVGTHAELVRAGGVYQRLWYSACSRRTA
jgi:ATP-binding cassette, subfamily C, bacterial CydC